MATTIPRCQSCSCLLLEERVESRKRGCIIVAIWIWNAVVNIKGREDRINGMTGKFGQQPPIPFYCR